MSNDSFPQRMQHSGAAFPHDSTTESPEHFGDPRAEYHAARTTAAVFDFSRRTQIELTGNDRAKFLHNFCTNDIKKLSPGQGCEAFLTNVKGRVLGHVFVFVGADSIWLETIPEAEAGLLAHLDRYLITEDVALHGRTAEWGELLVTGPASTAKLHALGWLDQELPVDGHSWGRFPTCLNDDNEDGGSETCPTNESLHVRRVDLLGTPGYLLAAPRPALGELWTQLTTAGVQPAGSLAFEPLRIEAGFPLYGRDITEDNLAQEVARTSRCISFTKGCYLGQEPIARIDALGHVNRELRRLHLESGPIPSAGDKVLSADGQEAGTITSAALSFADDRPVAFALLKSKFVAAGTMVQVRTGASLTAAQVWPQP